MDNSLFKADISLDGTKIYDESLKPVSKPTAELAGLVPRAVKAAFAPIEKWILHREYSVEQTRCLLNEKLKDVSPEKIVPPEPYIALPALEAISYCMDSDELRNLYANLLANSINVDNKEKVHPSFVEIIKQLSPLDALILKHIASNGHYLALCQLRRQEGESISEDSTIVTINPGDNFFKSASSGVPIVRNITYLNFSGETYEQFSAGIDNLSRLGLIETDYAAYLAKEEHYEPFLYHKPLLDAVNAPPEKGENGFYVYAAIKGRARTTALGDLFIEVCVQN